MRLVRILRALLRTPGVLGAALAMVVLAVLHPSPLSLGSAIGGLAVGVLGGTMLLQFGLLIGAALCGVRVHKIVIGVGARLHEWSTTRRTVVLRAAPITLGVAIGPGAAPVRRRMVAAGAVAAIIAVLGCGLSCWWVASGAGAAGQGLAIGAIGSVLHALRPERGVASTPTGWLLFGVPRLSGAQARELEAAPMVNEAMDAVNAGALMAASAAADALASAYPDLRSAVFTRVTVLEARGEYAAALPLVLSLLGAPDDPAAERGAANGPAQPAPDRRETALVLAGLAGLATAAVEAGQLDAEVGLPIARRAIDDVVDLGYPSAKLDGTRAVLELLTGSPSRAAELAASAAAGGDHRLTRADDLATLARARMALGDNGSARSALAKAEQLAAWWPRVVVTRARLDLG